MIGVSAQLALNCSKTPYRANWLSRLPSTVRELEQRWSLTLGEPFDDEVSCAWVTTVTLADGSPAVMKVGMPHMENKHEIHGLRFWNGDPTVRLLNADEELGAMLLERCEPGTRLRTLSETEQDRVIANLLHRLWRSPSAPHPFRPLSDLMTYWAAETSAAAERWPDSGLVREGLLLFEELSRNSAPLVLLSTDLHAGNVLQSRREPWLVIDPKPFIGDPAYDATQHLFNCMGRLLENPHEVICRFADLLGLDHERIRLWAFARAAAEPREDWNNDSSIALTHALG
jgi:streptomycin 6-kinase